METTAMEEEDRSISASIEEIRMTSITRKEICEPKKDRACCGECTIF